MIVVCGRDEGSDCKRWFCDQHRVGDGVPDGGRKDGKDVGRKSGPAVCNSPYVALALIEVERVMMAAAHGNNDGRNVTTEQRVLIIITAVAMMVLITSMRVTMRSMLLEGVFSRRR